MTAYRCLLMVYYTGHRINESVLQKIEPKHRLLAPLQKHKNDDKFCTYSPRKKSLHVPDILEGHIDY